MMAEAAPTLWQKLCYTRVRDALRFRFDASLHWRRVLAEADLPDELKQVVRDTVRATRLWNREKVDVARELVAHFQDGLERGRQVPLLVAKFGDSRQTASLIRRAKKRGRSVVWHIGYYSSIAFVVLGLLYIFYGIVLMTGRPLIKTDYVAVINERAGAVPEAARAWPLYRDALLSMGVTSNQTNADPVPGAINYHAEPGDADWPMFAAFLAGHAESIAMLRVAAERPELGFVTAISFAAFTPEERKLFGAAVTEEQIESFKTETIEDRWLVSTLLPHLQLLRTSALVLAGDARRMALSGDSTTALADLIAMQGISRHAQDAPFLVSLLVAYTVEKQSYAAIQDVLANQPQLWTNGQLRDLAHRVAATGINWRSGFEAERLFFYDVMQRIYTDDGRGNGRLAYRITRDSDYFQIWDTLTGEPVPDSSISNKALAVLALPAVSMIVESRRETTETYERIIGKAVAAFDKPLWQQTEPWPLDVDESLQGGGTFKSMRHLVVRLLVPAYDAVRSYAARNDGERDGVLVGIALELYHREHGAWPASLDELSPRWLPEVPVDRINGGPLGYKIVDDRPLVYSLGTDGRDDGGRPRFDRPEYAETFPVGPPDAKAAKGDWVIWSTVSLESVPKWEPVEMGAGDNGAEDGPAR